MEKTFLKILQLDLTQKIGSNYVHVGGAQIDVLNVVKYRRR